ncbi:MAG: NAD-binding protein [Desulfuromonadaceae bacterium]|nr:NAD-binding protein [Desulfuromonadaceae bacterium]MDD2855803.1 NAD-binding protein [Desulfuromonadaceae bacterium]
MVNINKSTSLLGIFGKYTRRYSWYLIIGIIVTAVLMFIGSAIAIALGFHAVKDNLKDSAEALGTLGAILGSAKAFWGQIRQKYSLAKLQIAKNHVVICGLGEKGMRLLETFLNKEVPYTVVVIDSKADHPEILSCWERGVVVVTGDAADTTILEYANASRAKFIFAVTGSDDVNIEIARKAWEVASATHSEGEDVFLRCFCHVSEASCRDVFSRHELFEKTHDSYDASMFSVYDSAARIILEKFSPDMYAKKENINKSPLRIVVIGFGKMGEAIVSQAARIGHYLHWDSVEITVVDQDIEIPSKQYLGSFGDGASPPGFIVPDVTIRFVQLDPISIASIYDIMGENNAPAIFYLALYDDSLAISLALRIRNMLGNEEAPMICCMKSSLSKLMVKNEFEFTLKRNIHAFNILDFACAAPVLMEEMTDEIARSIHSSYLISLITFSQEDFKNNPTDILLDKIIKDVPELKKNIVSGTTNLEVLNSILWMPDLYDHIKNKLPSGLPARVAQLLKNIGNIREHKVNELTIPQQDLLLRFNAAIMAYSWPDICPDKVSENSSLTSWRELTEDKKDSNRWQADHLSAKLRAIGFIDANDGSLERALTEQELMHNLSEMEHRRWSAALLMDGWRYGAGEKNPLRKTHPSLLPYEQLSDDEKAKDATMIRNIRNLIESKGWNTYVQYIKES